MKKLFCIPHAGASAMIYLKWQKFFPDVKIIPVEVAGRGTRYTEERKSSLIVESEDLSSFVKKNVDPEDHFAVFGHSMGCFMAFEVVRRLLKEKYYRKRLSHVFFSGNRAPHLNGKGAYHSETYKLSEKEFEKRVLDEGGTSAEVFENKSLFSVFVPILRADYKMTESYSYPESDIPKLECDISVMNGLQDSLSKYEVDQWGKYCSEKNEFDIQYFDGGHFYMNNVPDKVAAYINGKLLA